MGDAITALYKKNKLSAQDTAELLQKADAAGVDFPNPIPDKSAKARDGEEKRDTNAARTMDNWLKKIANGANSIGQKCPFEEERMTMI